VLAPSLLTVGSMQKSQAKSAALPDPRTTRRVELHGAGESDFRFGLADSESSSAPTRPVSATIQKRGVTVVRGKPRL
jgi:hypothetical protein